MTHVFETRLHLQSGVRWGHNFASVCSLREKSVAADKDDAIQVKEAFKWIMQGPVAKELGGVAVVTRVGDPLEEEKNELYNAVKFI